MKALYSVGAYEFQLSKLEARNLATSSLETDLVETQTKRAIKKIKLGVKILGPSQGAHLILYPPESCWEDASRIDINVNRRYLEEAKSTGQSRPPCNAGRVQIFVQR